jgi:uncharacterized protein
MGDSATTSLRGFGAAGIAAIVIVLLSGNIVLPNMIVFPAGAITVLAWTLLSRTPWSDIGYVRPKSWPLSIAIAVVGGAALKLLMKSLVMPLLGADPVNHAYHFLAGNRALLPNAIFAMCMAGFGEETVFRGFAFERLQKLFGSSIAVRAAIIAVTSLWFGLAHYQTQGLAGTEQAIFTGLVFGTAFAVTRSLYPVMIAHAAFDLTALAIIYCDAESAVAHVLLR